MAPPIEIPIDMELNAAIDVAKNLNPEQLEKLYGFIENELERQESQIVDEAKAEEPPPS